MTIETNNLVIYKSERLSDADDGGGKYSGQVVVDGLSNNLFADISELDRTTGNVSMRKIFPAITTNDTDALMGATLFVSENPKDPNVSALLFSTKSWTDTRNLAQSRVESYLAKGAQTTGTLLDTAYQGMKAVQVCMFETDTPASTGDTLVLAVNEGLITEKLQFIRITKVDTRIAKIVVSGSEKTYKIATYTISDGLDVDFIGLSAQQWYLGAKSPTLIRDSIVADSGKYYASVQVTEDVTIGQNTINAESIFAQLIPSAQTETPIINVNAASEKVTLVAGNTSPITASYATTVSPAQNLYLASSVLPKSLSFTLNGLSVSDQGGILKSSDGVQVATIDYQRGLIQWVTSAGNQTLNITFTPAAAPTQPYQSYAIPVTQQTQSNNWTGILTPIPAPSSLSISYMSQGKFYELRDDGTGKLTGSSSAFGSGLIDYASGSWLLTTGELPDIGTPILLLWGTPISTFSRANYPVAPMGIDFQLFHNGIVSATFTWLLNGVTKTATLANGLFTGDATGYMLYNSGKGRIIPNLLPQKGTVFTIAYDYGESKTQTISSVIPDVSHTLTFTIGTGAAIKENSVELTIPLKTGNTSYEAGVVVVKDVPTSGGSGNLVDSNGAVMGTIVYATGAIVITPVSTLTQFIPAYLLQTYAARGA